MRLAALRPLLVLACLLALGLPGGAARAAPIAAAPGARIAVPLPTGHGRVTVRLHLGARRTPIGLHGGAVRIPGAARLRRLGLSKAGRARLCARRGDRRRCVTLRIATVTPDAPAGALRSQKGLFEDLQYLAPDELDRRLDAYSTLGVRWARFQMLWSGVQDGGPDSWDWAPYDRLIDALVAHGIQPLPVLGTTPGWDRAAGCTVPTCGPTHPAAFGAFAAAAAQRYAGRVGAWEIWNEPNSHVFWSPAPDVATYTAVLVAAGDAIHAAAPGATVVTGGTAPGVTSDDGAWISPVDFLAGIYAGGGRGAFDAVGHHPYTWPELPGPTVSAPAWFAMDQGQESLRGLMVAHGDGAKKIWATEFGATTAPENARGVSEATQAAILQDGWNLWQRLPWAGPMIVYSLQDRGTAPAEIEDWFGLERADGTAKPALGVFAAL